MANISPNGGDAANYLVFYVGTDYPGINRTVVREGCKPLGYKYMFWASDEAYGYSGIYNGDSLIVYKDPNLLPKGIREDALRYGKPL